MVWTCSNCGSEKFRTVFVCIKCNAENDIGTMCKKCGGEIFRPEVYCKNCGKKDDEKRVVVTHKKIFGGLFTVDNEQ